MGPRTIVLRWGESTQAHSDWNAPDDVAVWISVSKLDEAWRLDHEYYVGAGGDGAVIDDRYERFGEWLTSTHGCVELPDVAINDGVVSFSDGRHRFAWLRDHGVQAMPVQVSPEQAQEFRERFGVAERVSIATW
ncbi:plasmid fertility inhibition factor family protein [Frateuria sp.]|uniref:plasmid fertility inhibition factor family protein n=1 Tax=Frateuria sp. TaxID=2211372 RepID=UPI0039C8990A